MHRIHYFNALALAVAILFAGVTEASIARQVQQVKLGQAAMGRAKQKCDYFAPPSWDFHSLIKTASKQARDMGGGPQNREIDIEYWSDVLCSTHPSKMPQFKQDAFLTDHKWQQAHPQLAEAGMAIDAGDQKFTNSPLARGVGGIAAPLRTQQPAAPVMPQAQQGAAGPAPQGWTAVKGAVGLGAAQPAPQANAVAQPAVAQPAGVEGTGEVGSANFDEQVTSGGEDALSAMSTQTNPPATVRTETHYVTRAAPPPSLFSTNTFGGFFIGLGAGMTLMYVMYEKITKPGEIKFSAAGLPVSRKARDVPQTSSALD